MRDTGSERSFTQSFRTFSSLRSNVLKFWYWPFFSCFFWKHHQSICFQSEDKLLSKLMMDVLHIVFISKPFIRENIFKFNLIIGNLLNKISKVLVFCNRRFSDGLFSFNIALIQILANYFITQSNRPITVSYKAWKQIDAFYASAFGIGYYLMLRSRWSGPHNMRVKKSWKKIYLRHTLLSLQESNYDERFARYL